METTLTPNVSTKKTRTQKRARIKLTEAVRERLVAYAKDRERTRNNAALWLLSVALKREGF